MNDVYALPLDSSGKQLSNLVEEDHVLSDKAIRAISPEKGVFFSDSLVIKEKFTNKILEKKKDYVLTEHYHALSMFHKKDLAGIIIITNPNVEKELTITYQALGELYLKDDEKLSEFIEVKNKDNTNSPLYWEVYNGLSKFVPSNVHVDIGDQIGFEYVNYGLEKIRSAIMLSDFDIVGILTKDIEEYLANLESLLVNKANNDYIPYLKDFIKEFDKIKLGLDKVINLDLLSMEEARKVAAPNYVYNNLDNYYVTLKAITAFKEEIYNTLLSKKQGLIGAHYTEIGVPTVNTLTMMTNGATVLLDAFENFSLGNSAFFDKIIYPDTSTPSDRWSITKIINNSDNRGGVFLGINLNSSETFIGVLRVSDSSTPTMVWKKQVSEYDIENVLDKLTKHIGDKNNPHKVQKSQIDLGNVENLAPVTREDITCRAPVRKYVTFDALLLFMKAYMNCVKTVADIGEDCEKNKDILRNIKLVFAPCSPCGSCCTPHKPMSPSELEEKKEQVVNVDPYDTLYGWYCQGNAKIGILADGQGGTYTKELEANSKDCSNDTSGG